MYPHDKYVKAMSSIKAALRAQLSQMMLFLIGASRVGKTTLIRELLDQLPEGYEGKVIHFEAPPKMTSSFTFKPYLLTCLRHLGDPFAALKTNSYSRMTNFDLMDLIVARIRQHGVRLVIVDEADVFASSRSGAQNYENLQFLKSIVNLTGVPHLFVGTPVLGNFMTMEAQVVNRSHVVRLAPYDAENPNHVKIFMQLALDFEKELLVPIDISVKANPYYLFEATNGCVGALKEMLQKLQLVALEHELPTITGPLIQNFSFYDPNEIRKEEIQHFYKKKKAKPPKKQKDDAKAKGGGKAKKSHKPGRRINPEDEVGGDA